MKKYPFVIIMVIILFAAVLLFVLRDEIKPVDDLMHPPSNSDEQSSIRLALEKETGNSVVFRTVENDSSSTSFYEDINVNGKDEALVFFSAGKSFDAVSFAVFEKKVTGYTLIAVVDTSYSDIEKVDFEDINGDGKNEIIIGVSSYNSNITRRLLIYNFNEKNEEPYIEKIYECNYSAYDVCDADADGTDDIFLISASSVSKLSENTAYLIYQDNNALKASDSIKLDASISSVVSVSSDYNKSEKASRFFIDGYTADGHMATDMIICSRKSHELERYSSFSAVSISKRDVNLYCTDVDGNGLLEIPCVLSQIQSDKESETSAHFILWTDVSKDGTQPVGKMLENQSKGFYLVLSEKIDKSCSVVTDNDGSLISFYSKNIENKPMLFEIAAFNNVQSGDVPTDYKLLTSEREYDYYYIISDEGKKEGISKADIMKLMAFEPEGSFE